MSPTVRCKRLRVLKVSGRHTRGGTGGGGDDRRRRTRSTRRIREPVANSARALTATHDTNDSRDQLFTYLLVTWQLV